MAKLSEAEIREAIKALMNENESYQRAALSSGNSFVDFLKSVGLHVIARKVADALSVAWDWVMDQLSSIADYIFGSA